MKSMDEQKLTEEDLFRTIDTSGDGKISLKEMEDVVRIFSDFKQKELHAIHNFFDVDNNGSIDRKEYNTAMRKVQKKYDKSK